MKNEFTDMNQDDDIAAQKLNQAAEQIHISPQFVEDLEQKLRQAHRPRRTWSSFLNHRLITSLSWITLLLITGLVLDWSIRNLARTAPGIGNGTPDFTCPVTQANGNLPPGTQTSENQATMNYGNDKLWTILPPDGKIHILSENQLPNGWLATSWPWWQETGTDSYLSIEGRRLDAKADALIGDTSNRFNNFVSTILIFPTTGCWEITARAGEASLTIVVDVVFDEVTATPGPITPVVTPVLDPTAISDNTGYDWRGTKLHLGVPLPKSPIEANVYLLQPDQAARADEARALAQQFEIEGETYKAPGELPDTTSYLVTDGRQRLYVRSKNYFTYYADYSTWVNLLGGKNVSEQEAFAAIDEFLKSHRFDFEYQIEKDYRSIGVYNVIPQTPDGRAIHFDYNLPARLQVIVGNHGQVIQVDSNQINYEPLREYGILTAEEAFQKVLGISQTTQAGVQESMQSGGVLNENLWWRSYPEDQTITIYGRVNVFEPIDASQPPFVSIDSYTVTGNAPPSSGDLIEATGQFHTEGGIRKFNVDTWKVSDAMETSMTGTIRRDSDQIILVTDIGEEYALADTPPDVPLNTKFPEEQLIVNGLMVNGSLVWTSIQYFPPGSNIGGGGGGGGVGFYKLNLSGTPVPFINETPTLSPNSTAPAANQGTVPYVVQQGDTLLSIAQAFWTTPERISQVNGFSSGEALKPGITIIIPDIPGVLPDLAPLGRRIEGLRGNVSITIYK